MNRINPQLHRTLPWMAAAGLLVVVISMLFTSNQRAALLQESPETRTAAQTVLEKLQAAHPASMADKDFRRQADAALKTAYMDAIWLFDAQGTLIHVAGSVAQSPMYKNLPLAAGEAAPQDTLRLLEALPDGTLQETQRTRLLAAAVMRGAGDHNDIYRHRLAEISASDGSVVGLVGVAYDASPLVQQPDSAYRIGLAAFLIGLCVYWLALPAWVMQDARRRGEKAVVWGVLVLVGNLVALLAYLLTRRSDTQLR